MSSSSLTKAQFIKQADAICRKADSAQLPAMQRVSEEFTGSQREEEALERAEADAALKITGREATELAALGAPAGDVSQVTAIVEGIEKAVKEAEEGPPEDIGQPFNGVDKLAAGYGLKDCSEAL